MCRLGILSPDTHYYEYYRIPASEVQLSAVSGGFELFVAACSTSTTCCRLRNIHDAQASPLRKQVLPFSLISP